MLSQRETEVAYLVCEGLTNKEIAEKLSISVHTVMNHVEAIFAKTGVRNRAGMQYALYGKHICYRGA